MQSLVPISVIVLSLLVYTASATLTLLGIIGKIRFVKQIYLYRLFQITIVGTLSAVAALIGHTLSVKKVDLRENQILIGFQNDVRHIQLILFRAGNYRGLIDGIPGVNTFNAIKAYRIANHIDQGDSTSLDKKTFETIFEIAKKQSRIRCVFGKSDSDYFEAKVSIRTWGDFSQTVRHINGSLLELNCGTLKEDSVLDLGFVEQVVEFQRKYMQLTNPDGELGPETLMKLFEVRQSQMTSPWL